MAQISRSESAHCADTTTKNKEMIRMEEKKIVVMGLTKEQWKEYNELLAHANKEQIEHMILLAALKLPEKQGVDPDESN